MLVFAYKINSLQYIVFCSTQIASRLYAVTVDTNIVTYISFYTLDQSIDTGLSKIYSSPHFSTEWHKQKGRRQMADGRTQEV